MKNILILFICFFLNSCLTEPKKDIKIEPKTELKNDLKIEKQTTDTKVNKKEDDVLDKTIPLQTFENESEIYSHFDGCGCYFSNNKDNFIVGKENVFFGEIVGKEGSIIELLIDGNIEKLIYDVSTITETKQYILIYKNSKHSASIILTKENLKQEETVFFSGSITVDEKYFSLLFGRCGC